MTAIELLAELRAHGVTVRLENGELELEAKAPPPAHLLQALKGHKVALLALLELKRTPGDGCPDHWRHIPVLPAKGEPVVNSEKGRYCACLFNTWYIICFCPHIGPTHVEATAQDGKHYAAPSMDSLYRALWAEAFHAELTLRVVS